MTAVYGEGGGGEPVFLLLSNNVLDTKGEGCGYPPPTVGDVFWIFGVLKTRFFGASIL